jgi:hypothetical protein
MSRGMYFEGLRNKEEFAKNIAGKEAVASKKEIELEASKSSNGGNPALRSTEDVNKIDEELLKAETFLKDAESKGEKERAEFYRNEVNYLKNKPQKQIIIAQGQEGSSRVDQIKGSENANNQKKYIQNLGYSNEEILNLSVEDMNRIVENQITRDEWFKNKTTQPNKEDESAPVSAEDKSNLPSNQVGGSSIRVEVPKGVKFEVSTTLPDGSSFGASSGPGKLMENFGVIETQGKNSAAPSPENGAGVTELSIIEKNQGVLEKTNWDERKDILEKKGWTKKKYEILSKEDQDYIYWNGIKEENYSRKRKEGNGEDMN